MSLLGFLYFAAYAIIFGLVMKWAQAHFAGTAIGATLSAVY